jgi:hypothetical protein
MFYGIIHDKDGLIKGIRTAGRTTQSIIQHPLERGLAENVLLSKL